MSVELNEIVDGVLDESLDAKKKKKKKKEKEDITYPDPIIGIGGLSLRDDKEDEEE